MLGGIDHRAAQRFEDGAAFGRRDVQPAKAGETLRLKQIFAMPIRHGAGDHDFRRLAAAQFEDQPGGDFETRSDKGQIEAALETVTRIADDVEPTPGGSGADRIEQGRLDEHLSGRFGATGRLAADYAAEALYA